MLKVVYIVRYQHKVNNVLTRLNLPGPKGKPFFGTLSYLWWTDDLIVVHYTKILRQGTKVRLCHVVMHLLPLQRYGKAYAFQEGAHVYVVTSDLEQVQDVLQKQYANFHERKVRNTP